VKAPPIESYADAVRNNAVVAAFHRAGRPAHECIVALAKINADLIAQVMELEAMRPRRYRVGDVEWVYRCPTDAIPVVQLEGPNP